MDVCAVSRAETTPSRIAMMENEILANMGPRPVSDEENLAGEALKSSIIDQLKEL